MYYFEMNEALFYLKTNLIFVRIYIEIFKRIFYNNYLMIKHE